MTPLHIIIAVILAAYLIGMAGMIVAKIACAIDQDKNEPDNHGEET